MAESPQEPEAHVEKKKPETQIETLEKALETERRRSEEYLTQLKYARADIENLKKRFDRELEDAKSQANEHLIAQLLEIADELEMAVKSAESCGSTENLVQGVEMILKKLTKTLQKEETYPIKSVGETFDPQKHDAVARIEKQGAKENIVVEEVRKGYTMKGKVIRPSIVKITVPLSQSQKETKGGESK